MLHLDCKFAVHFGRNGVAIVGVLYDWLGA